MAGEFKIKTGLLLGPQPTQSVTSIRDTSISITSDASSLLVTGKAVYDFVMNNVSQSYWTLDGSTLVPSDDSVDIQLTAIQIETDAGAVDVIDMDVSSAGAGVEESYAFNIDGSTIAKIYSKADGAGALQETAFVVEGNYQYMGDPETNGSWRFYVSPDASADMVFEKRVGGSWIEKGRFE